MFENSTGNLVASKNSEYFNRFLSVSSNPTNMRTSMTYNIFSNKFIVILQMYVFETQNKKSLNL